MTTIECGAEIVWTDPLGREGTAGRVLRGRVMQIDRRRKEARVRWETGHWSLGWIPLSGLALRPPRLTRQPRLA